MLRKSREVVRHLDQSTFLQFGLFFLLTFVYFLQLWTFVLSIDEITAAPLLTKKGFLLIILTFLALGAGIISFVYAITLAIWTFSSKFNGQATLQETRAAIICAMLWTIPIGFYLLIIYLTIRDPSHGSLALGMRIAAYLATPVTLVSSFIVLLKTVSEMNRFGIWRAFLSVVLGFISLGLLLFFVYSVF